MIKPKEMLWSKIEHNDGFSQYCFLRFPYINQIGNFSKKDSFTHLVMILWTSFPNSSENGSQLRVDLMQKENFIWVYFLLVQLEEIFRLEEIWIKVEWILFNIWYCTELQSIKTHLVENEVEDGWVGKEKVIALSKKMDTCLIKFVLKWDLVNSFSNLFNLFFSFFSFLKDFFDSIGKHLHPTIFFGSILDHHFSNSSLIVKVCSQKIRPIEFEATVFEDGKEPKYDIFFMKEIGYLTKIKIVLLFNILWNSCFVADEYILIFNSDRYQKHPDDLCPSPGLEGHYTKFTLVNHFQFSFSLICLDGNYTTSDQKNINLNMVWIF